jgi:hypothetical protein
MEQISFGTASCGHYGQILKSGKCRECSDLGGIKTEYWAKPSPERQWDWSALRPDVYDGAPDSSARHMIGYGRTEQAAIDDLLEQEEDGTGAVEER